MGTAPPGFTLPLRSVDVIRPHAAHRAPWRSVGEHTMYFDPLYWVLFGIGAVLSLFAQFKVKSSFAKYSQVATRSGLTGAQVAQRILEANGIRDVDIESVPGDLTDHYDPKAKVLRLSRPVYGSRSIAAAGVAAHEVGHAIQHANGYAPLKFRSAWVPVANFGGGLSMFVLMGSAMLGGAATATGDNLASLGILLFATTTVFTLVTLPVEFDASRQGPGHAGTDRHHAAGGIVRGTARAVGRRAHLPGGVHQLGAHAAVLADAARRARRRQPERLGREVPLTAASG